MSTFGLDCMGNKERTLYSHDIQLYTLCTCVNKLPFELIPRLPEPAKCSNKVHTSSWDINKYIIILQRRETVLKQSPVRERPQSENTVVLCDKRLDEEYSDDEVIKPSIYPIMEWYLRDPVLSQFRGLCYFAALKSKLIGIGGEILEIREV